MLHTFAAAARQIIEFVSVLIIIAGVVVASWRLTRLCWRGCHDNAFAGRDGMIQLRLSFESTLMLGLQFLMAADIIGTISNPDLQGVIILSVIVLLRVILSFTLSREVAEIDKQKRAHEERELNMKIMPEDITIQKG